MLLATSPRLVVPVSKTPATPSRAASSSSPARRGRTAALIGAGLLSVVPAVMGWIYKLQVS
ncbi:MAG: hypothetical protein M3203_12910, partial [Actinomycetota bacterium]|nr:hypothetical protein [Actinomycetota bacterium]